MWNKFSDKKPENEQLCIVEGELPIIYQYREDTDFNCWDDGQEAYDCDKDDYWTPYPFDRLEI